MASDRMTRAVHCQMADPGTRWIKDPDIAVDSDGPLDAKAGPYPERDKSGPGIPDVLSRLGTRTPKSRLERVYFELFFHRRRAMAEGSRVCGWMPAGRGGGALYLESRRDPFAGRRLSDVCRGGGPSRREVRSAAPSSALSLDDGLVWEREQGVRLGGEHTSYGAPRCLYLDPGRDGQPSRYRLYASASPFPDTAPPPGAFNGRNIVSAVSGDGLHFELEPGVRVAQESELESFSVYAPEVLRLSEGGYRMYYAGWVAAPEVPGRIEVSRQNLQRLFARWAQLAQIPGHLPRQRGALGYRQGVRALRDRPGRWPLPPVL